MTSTLLWLGAPPVSKHSHSPGRPATFAYAAEAEELRRRRDEWAVLATYSSSQTARTRAGATCAGDVKALRGCEARAVKVYVRYVGRCGRCDAELQTAAV